MKRVLSLLLLLAAFGGILCAQAPVLASDTKWNSTWTMTASKTSGFEVGDVVTLTFTGTPIASWHLYSADPSGEIAYNNTNLEFFKDEFVGAELSGVMKDGAKPHEELDELMGGIIRHFDNGQKVSFTQKVKITATKIDVTGQFNAQICQDNGSCVFARFPFTWKATATNSAGVIIKVDTPRVVVDTVARDTQPQPTDTVVRKESVQPTALAQFPCEQIYFEPYQNEAATASCDAGSLFSLFLNAFIFGLFAIFTPCVFPIIPMTVSFFTKQSKTRQQGIRNAMIYSGSIVFIYVVLGLLLTVAFGPKFLYQFSTHWITNVVFFILLVVFALSFFGWFEITLPSSLSTKINKGSDRGGMIGIFFMALTLVVVSFSCTGPIVGTVLISAGSAGGCFWMPIVGMFGFALAMSIPFGLFAMFPGMMNSMPSAGGWLNSVKVVLGFIELALAMKFLSSADLIQRWHILDRDVFIGIWMVLFFLMGMYLLGKIRLPHDSPLDSIPVPRFMLAVVTFGFVAYLLPGMFGKPLNILEGVIPPITNNIGVNVRGGVARAETQCAVEDRNWAEYFSDHEGGEYCWFYDYCEAADYAQQVGKPLFVDFTGHSCANCRKMETTVFTSPAVGKYFLEDYVLVSLWVDDKTRLPEIYTNAKGEKLRTIGDVLLDFEQEKIMQNSQPYYVLMDVENDTAQVMVPPIGFDDGYNVVAFKDYLESGVKAYKGRHKKEKPQEID